MSLIVASVLKMVLLQVWLVFVLLVPTADCWLQSVHRCWSKHVAKAEVTNGTLDFELSLFSFHLACFHPTKL